MNERLATVVLAATLALAAGCISRETGSGPVQKDATPDEAAAGVSKREVHEPIALPRRPPEPPPPRVSFNFIDMPMSSAAREIASACRMGVSMLSDPGDPPPISQRRVTLAMHDVELPAALDWLMRQVDASYSLSERLICISTDPARLYGGALVQRVYPLGTMRRYDLPSRVPASLQAELESIFYCVRQCLAEYLARRPAARVTLSPTGTEFVAVCSDFAHRRIEQVLAEIARNKEDPPPLFVPDDAPLRRKLTQSVQLTPGRQQVVRLVAWLGSQVDVNVGLDPRELSDGVQTTVPVEGGETTLWAALDAIVKKCGLRGYEIEPERGIWLHGARPYRQSCRVPWEGWLIRSYYVEPLQARLGLPRLLQFIRENVTPGEWNGNLPAMCYAPSGRLIVFHSREGHAEIASCLARLGNSAGP